MTKSASGTPLSKEQRQWLSKLDAAIWDRSQDRFGHWHSFPSMKRKISADELDRVLRAVMRHDLPTVMGSGPYGNLSMAVYDHCDVPGVMPDRVAVLHEDHFEQGIGKKFEDWRAGFDHIARWTHSPRNREVLAHYGMPAPREPGHYEY